jgi:hypothetical protein
MKELEALERIRETLKKDINFPLNLTEEYSILKKALTPPTQEEVCEALSDWYREKIIFQDNMFVLKRSKISVIQLDFRGFPQFKLNLPIRISKKVILFYESLEENK